MLPPLLEVHRSTRMPTCGPNHTLDRRHGVPADAGAEDTPAAIAGAPESTCAFVPWNAKALVPLTADADDTGCAEGMRGACMLPSCASTS
ncbi:MAG: hypothetical protein VX000_08150, partial [Myxococcota bacterium]|nr:hypothetical protein [Myxococcota bacterium]